MLDSVIAALESKKQEQAIADEKFVREQRVLDELAPRLWSKARLALKGDCEKRPQYFTFRVGANSGATVTCYNRHALEVEYLSASKVIAFRIVNPQADDFIGTYRIGLDGNGQAAIFDAEGKILPSVIYLADELLTLTLQPS